MSKSTNRQCPLTFNENENWPQFFECKGEQCGWFVRETNACAIPMLAVSGHNAAIALANVEERLGGDAEQGSSDQP